MTGSAIKILLISLTVGISSCELKSINSNGQSEAFSRRSKDYCKRIETLAEQNFIEQMHCGISRGPKTEKKIAFVFTAGYFCEGGLVYLDSLKKYGAKASFFLMSPAFTGGDPATRCDEVIPRILSEGHYVGPHSHAHPDMASSLGGKTLVTHKRLNEEIGNNVQVLKKNGVKDWMRYWIPPSETYNSEIATWSYEKDFRTVYVSECPYTGGDYLPIDIKNGMHSNESTIRRIFDCEMNDPNGLNGYILFLHLGIGTSRAEKDKFYNVFPALMEKLVAKGYSFVRIDELLDPVLTNMP